MYLIYYVNCFAENYRWTPDKSENVINPSVLGFGLFFWPHHAKRRLCWCCLPFSWKSELELRSGRAVWTKAASCCVWSRKKRTQTEASPACAAEISVPASASTAGGKTCSQTPVNCAGSVSPRMKTHLQSGHSFCCYSLDLLQLIIASKNWAVRLKRLIDCRNQLIQLSINR